jgi:ATP-binding cassette subfamily B protein
VPRGGGQDRSIRTLAALLRMAVRMVWVASPRRVVLLVVVQFGASVSLFASVLLIGEVLEVFLLVGRGEASVGNAALPVVLLALVTAATALALAVGQLQQRVLGELVERGVWRDLLQVSQTVDLRTFDDPTFYDQAARVQAHAAWRTGVVVQALVLLVGDTLGVIAGTAGLLTIAPALTPLLLLSGVPLLLASRLSGHREFRFAVEHSHDHRERDYLQDVLTHRNEAKEVRAFSLSGLLGGHWEKKYAAYLSDLRRHVAGLVRLTIAGNLAAALLTGAALMLALLLVARGVLGVSAAGAALVAVRLLAARVSGASRGLSDILGASPFLQDLLDFKRRAGGTGRAPLPTAPDRFDQLVVSDVHFTYPDASRPALRGASIRIRRGEIVALVGGNGSGKTTLAKLLANLYQPDGGSVTWDGVDVRGYEPDSLRRRVAVLFQDFIRYRFDGHTNIALGRTDEHVDREVVRAAARRADADAFLGALPAGYDTILSKEYEGGTELSLGQWQRVALARAFVRNAPFIILDEPSASLDARAEYALFERLRDLFAGRTVLVISHRFSTVRTADRIYVLADGRVSEEGDHAALMERNGVYAEMFKLQAAGYVD